MALKYQHFANLPLICQQLYLGKILLLIIYSNKISKIDNLINAIVVSVNEIDASFTIDKKELPASMRFDMNMTIDVIQIPEKAKIKFFMVHW